MSRLARSLISVAGALFLGAAGLVLPAPAVAATTPTIVEVGDGYHFVGGAENNDVSLSVVLGRLIVHDEGATSFGHIGAKCFAVPAVTGATVSCKLKSPTVFHADLGDGDDLLNGAGLPQLVRLDVRTGDGHNAVVGGNGIDRLRGQASASGSDSLNGGPGNDQLTAGTGPAAMFGGNGHDIFVGGPGNDFVDGGNGNDFVRTDGGNDTILGGAGNDGLSGDGGNDQIDGGPGNDHVYGGSEDDLLVGGTGRDLITGNEGDDVIDAADDQRDGGDCGAGNDTLTGDAPTVFLGLPVGGDMTFFNNCEVLHQV